MARMVVLIEAEDRRGLGKEGDPVRLVTQYFTPDGSFVVEKPDHHVVEQCSEACRKRRTDLTALTRQMRSALIAARAVFPETSEGILRTTIDNAIDRSAGV